MPARKPGISPPRGVRWPPEVLKKIDALAKEMANTYSGTVIYLCKRGLEAIQQDERDRIAGREFRIASPWDGIERRKGERRKLEL